MLRRRRPERPTSPRSICSTPALARFSPTLGVRVAQAAARAEARARPLASRCSTRSIRRRPSAYQPYWAVRARLLAETGADGPARAAYARAIALAEDPGGARLARVEEAARHVIPVTLASRGSV